MVYTTGHIAAPHRGSARHHGQAAQAGADAQCRREGEPADAAGGQHAAAPVLAAGAAHQPPPLGLRQRDGPHDESRPADAAPPAADAAAAALPDAAHESAAGAAGIRRAAAAEVGWRLSRRRSAILSGKQSTLYKNIFPILYTLKN